MLNKISPLVERFSARKMGGNFFLHGSDKHESLYDVVLSHLSSMKTATNNINVSGH